MRTSRRTFLRTGLSGMTYFSTVATAPLWIQRAAGAVCADGLPDDRILVIFQQAGGNDGLNTVIPYTNPKYVDNGPNALRPTSHIISGLEATELGDGLNAFHPRLERLKNWYSNGNVAVVQNVGYPNPNLSHFLGTDLWELGISPSSNLLTRQGWASRYFDSQCSGMPPAEIDPLNMMAAGMCRLPLTLANSEAYLPPAVGSFEDYQIRLPDTPAELGAYIRNYIDQASGQAAPMGSALDFVQRAANIAQVSVDDMAIANQTPVLHPYPEDSRTLGPGLEMVSRIIRTEDPRFKTRIFYVTQGGYDTHANQFNAGQPSTGTHADLLEQMDRALDAFMNEMADSGNLDRVVLMSFSEFGRRPQENGSNGTDHGTANCLFALGGRVNGGIYGGQPDLDDLTSGNQGGNLQFKIDFRSVFSVIIRDWLGSDPEDVFGPDFTDEAFTIASGMPDVPIINNEPANAPAMPAANGTGVAVGAALAGLAAAWALRDHTPKTEEAPARNDRHGRDS